MNAHRIKLGQQFLMRGIGRGDVLTLSRYDQMNLSADHPMFDIYLKDLQALQREATPAQHGRQLLERMSQRS